MARMGHSSTRAALIYQHASRDREGEIAAAISARVEAARAKSNGHVAGTAADSDASEGTSDERERRP